MASHDERVRRMEQVIENYGTAGFARESIRRALDGNERYLLIEEQIGEMEMPYFATLHSSRTAASTYNLSQEFAEDWKPLELVDLETGEHYDPKTTITWVTPGEGD